MENRDELFRDWYNKREGTKYESFAYDVWCAAWKAARKEEDICRCLHPVLCDLHDRCVKDLR